MKILIVGAGASGVVAAIEYKRNHLKDDVLIIERLDKPLKKILATGNGKCNLGNKNLDISKYNNSKFVEEILKEFDLNKQLQFFKSICVETKNVDGLIYPISESAITVREALLSELNKLRITINCDESIIDYKVDMNSIFVRTNKAEYKVDKLIFSVGGKSNSKLGSDGSSFLMLEKHGYSFKNINSGLCPIRTKEETRILDGIRSKSCVKLLKNGSEIHSEIGEVLFKDHGLSGIVIFNTSSMIARDTKSSYKLLLDLLPNNSVDELENYCKNHTNTEFLRAFLHPKMVQYIEGNKAFETNLIHIVKNLPFTFDKLYGFDFSQVSVGGIKIEEISTDLESKREQGVYFIGEVLDVDGPCGGYNLMWAFASAMKISK